MASRSRHPRYVPQRGQVLWRMIKRLLPCFFSSDHARNVDYYSPGNPPREKETQKGKQRRSSRSLHSMVSNGGGKQISEMKVWNSAIW
ncbi:hypothetical protein C4D60_Mb08t23180 [Musa balbisiana]|uniref:Uncharacterized protein n=1 Tax=Musa balbisiana TaxID=52838 RepID=A0A4S8K5W9_MUSBA|nr:hypothetical protein C4D60_Mb08t23180 [Musa balbisiana]